MPEVGNIRRALTGDEYGELLQRFDEILEDCRDQGILNLREQLLREVRMIADEVDDVVSLVNSTRDFERDFRSYARDHVLFGPMATNVGNDLVRVMSAAALESAFRQQGLNEGEIAVSLELITSEPLDLPSLAFLLTKRNTQVICKLSIFGAWVTWSASTRPENCYIAVSANSQFFTLASELGIFPPPQQFEEWLVFTYVNSPAIGVQFPRIFDAAASGPPWNPYFTASGSEDDHGWARDVVSGALVRPEGIHGPVDANVLAMPAKKFEL